MSDCQHSWKMTNVQFGFSVFERCSHCQSLRTYYSSQDTWDQYQEGEHSWSIVENAQTLRFDLECRLCHRRESFQDLLGLMYCTSCLPDCEAERIRKEAEKNRTWILVAFSHLPDGLKHPVGEDRLAILSDYFNQRRDTTRSTIRFIPFTRIKKISLCRGEFIHDVGMLSLEPQTERKALL